MVKNLPAMWETQARVLDWDAIAFSDVCVCVCVCVCVFPGSSDGKESACNVGDPGSVPGPGRSPGEGTGNPLQ